MIICAQTVDMPLNTDNRISRKVRVVIGAQTTLDFAEIMLKGIKSLLKHICFTSIEEQVVTIYTYLSTPVSHAKCMGQ